MFLMLTPTELFDREVQHAILMTPKLDFRAWSKAGRMDEPMMTRLLLERTQAGWASSNCLVSAIKEAVDVLMDGYGRQSEEQRLEYMHALCAAAVTHLGSYRSLELLQNNDQTDDPHRKTSHDALTAAAYLGDISMVTSLLDQTADAHTGSPFFGLPLQVAAG